MAGMNGILLMDKPAGWTSHDVVAKLRGILGERRIGHSGTLDPMATGLLVVFVGRATKAVSFSEAHEKHYTAHLRLGVVTDTQDITGTVLETYPVTVTQEAVVAALEGFRGDILQLPPMYSAIKIGGRKLYDVARRGGEVEREARSITIHQLDCTGRTGEDYILEVTCSKGTYIRTLCHDIGETLGCGGTLTSLRRTRVGNYSVEDAHTMEEMLSLSREQAESLLLPLDSLFSDHPAVTLNEQQERLCRNGVDFQIDAEDGTYRFYDNNGEFLMLGTAENQRSRAIKRFF